ncbi:hypothetical protein [Aureimonas sp. AU12]|uniref:hypothetical protein n=1 Tax=Aureimonas sp. AU12 TaxID=1638161 RepID=UPI0009EAC09C|nr:hypothetical protein [Aureimonas sp. AU12]
MSKKPIEISALLAWTYGEELPKLERFLDDEREEFLASPAPWDSITRLAILGVRVDTSGRAPDVRALEYPDPDALIVHEAVQGLASWEIAMPEGWSALGDCTGLTAAEMADAHRDGLAIAAPKGDRLAALIRRLAMTGRTPPWHDHGPIFRRLVCGANGKPAWFRMVRQPIGQGRPSCDVEVDGYNKSRQRPYEGAYRKHYLDPSPSVLVSERVDYQLWALALHALAGDLARRLGRFTVLPCRVPMWPWEGEEGPSQPRVLVAAKSTEPRQAGNEAA